MILQHSKFLFFLVLMMNTISCKSQSFKAIKEFTAPEILASEIQKFSWDSLTSSQKQVFDSVQYKTFQYFWEGAEPNSGLARERIHLDGDYPDNDFNIVTTGGSGFGLMAVLVGVERGWISYDSALNRLNKIVRFLENCDRFHGVWPHWIDGNTGKVKPFGRKDNGGDLVESSFLWQGLITCSQYMKERNLVSTQHRTMAVDLIKRIDKLWLEVDFQWYSHNENVLYWHWSPEYKWEMNFPVRGYNECLIMYVLAASHPTMGISKQHFTLGWGDSGNITNIHRNQTKSYHPLNLRHQGNLQNGGPLFWAHYSFLGLNPFKVKDDYLPYNFGVENTMHVLNCVKWCIRNPLNYKGYSDSSWGLTSSYSVRFYHGHAADSSRDVGVISPTAALSSFPYTPEYSLKAMMNWYNNKPELFLKYGFVDAFSEEENWYKPWYLAIDQGPIVCMMENFRSGLLWSYFMKSDQIKKGLLSLDFVVDLNK